jgi:two-component system response regulator AtoC
LPKLVNRPDFKPTVFHGMVTVSPAMLAFFALLTKVAATEASILMRGETGTGKELAARAIHALSRRAKGPFNAVNCATFSSELMMSELFGHVRGAFTGATSDRKGVFELSNGGSLFLDEIAEIPIEVQARLLRVLQDRTFTPLGSTTPRTSNVRLISATHVALRSAVEEGRFREDLMYRIRVIPLFLPRLAERAGDVEMLAWQFIDEFKEAGYRPIRVMEAQARGALVAHSWPGNVRELRNVVEYASAIGDGDVLRVSDLPPELRGERPSTAKSQTLGDIERQRILDALEKARGQRGEAAAHLGMARSTLWRKMREYGIVSPIAERGKR